MCSQRVEYSADSVSATASGLEIAARVYRGPHLEAEHCAAVAVVDASGRITHHLGDPRLVTMMRSSIKPFQALPFVMRGGPDKFGFSNKQLAILCGSHSGTDEHLETALANLKAAGNAPADLDCGAHVPMFMQLNGTFPTKGEDKDPLRHNCSGKHSGFLALAKLLGEPTGDYLNPKGRTQQLVKQALADACEYDSDKLIPAIDGCSAPNYPLPLWRLALGFRKFANAEGNTEEMRSAFRRLKAAITEHPHMVSGEKRLDLNLMRSFVGNIVCKGGAESLQAIGFSEPKIGIAIKVLDGNSRALGAIVVEVLRQLGVISDIEKYPHLRSYVKPEIRNAHDRVTGYIGAEFRLRKVE
ncbi:MAG: asparaginase [candidate division Zixibacteria bacterium]|nr:asparaginase [candidate division Zixibacteria bacterium]